MGSGAKEKRQHVNRIKIHYLERQVQFSDWVNLELLRCNVVYKKLLEKGWGNKIREEKKSDEKH